MLFSDIEGSMALQSRLGDRYAEVVSAQRALLRAAFSECGGHEMGTERDAFFVVFQSAGDAVRCAVAAQRALSGYDWPGGVAVRCRMGLLSGEPTRHEDGYVGLDIHRAARIAAAAHGGQVVLPEVTRLLVQARLPAGVSFRDLGFHRLKDIEAPEHLYQLAASGLQEKFPPLKSLGTRVAAAGTVSGVPLAARVVEVIADRGVGRTPRYRCGSGCLVAGRTVLTATHVVAGAVSVAVRGPDKVVYQAAVDPGFIGDAEGPGPDLALIEIIDGGVDVPPMGLAAVDRGSPAGHPVERCHVIGYPQFMERVAADGGRYRETADAVGQVPVLSGLAGGLLSVQVSSTPQPLPPLQVALGDSPWSGMSGAPVVAGGYLLAVVTEHAAREGTSAITATPLTALERDPTHPGWGPGVANAGAWWARLGVSGAGALILLPAPLRGGKPAYWATVVEIRQRTGMLTGREDELAEIVSFAAGDEGYRWLAGEAWAGKTSLLAEAVTTLPGDVYVVCYFLSRREADADSSRFLAAVIPQLAFLLDEDPPAAELHQFRALWQRAAERANAEGRHLLMVVDGLDEDLHPPGVPSVAALLPATAGGRAHVLVSSRTNSGLPADIPAGHPLRRALPVPVKPFSGAQELAVLARQERVETARVALIRYNTPGGTPCVGSGLLIDKRRVLTADHVAEGSGHYVECGSGTRPAVAVLRSGTPRIDLAVLTLSEEVADFPQLGCVRIDRDQVGQVDGCVAVGFPRWRKDGDHRRSAQVNGRVPTAEGLGSTADSGLHAGWLTLVGDRIPGAPEIPVGTLSETAPSPWGGMSGAVVVADHLVVGVVCSHNLAAGGQSLTVTPVTAVDQLPGEVRQRFWDALGVADPARLPVLPGGAAWPGRVTELRGQEHRDQTSRHQADPSAGRSAFVSYSHRDERYRERLDISLVQLRRNNLISIWHDKKILPGQEWGQEIDTNLENADIILLLVSPDFLASEYAYSREMLRAVERHQSGSATVVPIILRPSDWKDSPLGALQALPSAGRPVSSWPNRDQAWLDVAQGLRRLISNQGSRF